MPRSAKTNGRSCGQRSLTEELSGMTNDLFDVSRIQECRLPVKRAMWDLTQMARDVRSDMTAIGGDHRSGSGRAGRQHVLVRAALAIAALPAPAAESA